MCYLSMVIKLPGKIHVPVNKALFICGQLSGKIQTQRCLFVVNYQERYPQTKHYLSVVNFQERYMYP